MKPYFALLGGFDVIDTILARLGGIKTILHDFATFVRFVLVRFSRDLGEVSGVQTCPT